MSLEVRELDIKLFLINNSLCLKTNQFCRGNSFKATVPLPMVYY